jgi:iron complex transport system substrate-binding protein
MNNLMKNAIVFCALSIVSVHAESVKVIVDDLGREFSTEVTPRKLVSLAPSNTELLCILGLNSRIVGRTKYCNFPKEIESVEVVAGFNTLDLEKIAALNPDLVIAIRGNNMDSLRGLERLKIPFFSLDIKNIDELLAAIERLGDLLGVADRADSIVANYSNRLKNIRRKVGGLSDRPSVMWGLGDNTFYTAGPNTMINDVIRLAGGVNVARSTEGSWPQVSVETVLMWSPEIIITTQDEGGKVGLAKKVERLRKDPVWGKIPAIVNNEILYIEADLLLRPGPRLIKALELISEFIVAYHSNKTAKQQ